MNKALLHRTIWFLLLLFQIGQVCLAQAPEEKPEEKPYLKLGGAVRFNYSLSTWKRDQLERGRYIHDHAFAAGRTALQPRHGT